jgi:invasion protein IalB
MKSMMLSSGTRFRVGMFGVIAILGLGSQAVAQGPKSGTPSSVAKSVSFVDAEPNSTSANFGDWILRCQRLGNGAETQRVCEVAQQIRAQNQQNPVAELAIGRLKKADPLRLTVVLPVNVNLSNAPSFSADGKATDPLDFGWRKCLPEGCIADALLKDDVLQRWKIQGNAGRVTWTDAAGHDLAIGLSFRGLSQALDALSKQS